VTARLALRELASPAEFRETMDVSKEAWQFADREVSPAADLIAATHAGGLTAGAFLGKRMIGFVHGVPRVNRGEPCLHSHLLAIRPEAQGKRLSAKLKLFQRDWSLARGIRLVTWTYDPFLIKNAKLNLGRLRATVSALLPDFYGHMGGIYGAIPTDRFEVSWRLDDPIVERAARGEEPLPGRDTSELPVALPGRRLPSAPSVLVPFPAGAPGLYRTHPEVAIAARRSFGRTVTRLFERGYVAIGVVERPDGPAYLLERH